MPAVLPPASDGQGDRCPDRDCTTCAEADRDRDGNTLAAARSVANTYGATYYDTPEEMHDAHPMADVSALGVDTILRPTAIENLLAGINRPSVPSAYRQQIAMYQKMIYATTTAAQAALVKEGKIIKGDVDLGDGGTPKQKRKPQPRVRTGDPKFVAALEAKRNRPAPPGAGIDRRRGRLR